MRSACSGFACLVALFVACGNNGATTKNDAGGAGAGGGSSGGSAQIGGAPASGGATATVTTGGATATGGAVTTGGAMATGGAMGTGGGLGEPDAAAAESDAGAAGRGAPDAARADGGGSVPPPVPGKPSCAAGPFPAPMMQSSKVVCANFPFAYDSNEGPTWIASQNAFFFSNYNIRQASGGDIIKYTPGGDCDVFIKGVGCNGLAVTNDGNILAACQQSRSLVRFDIATKQATTVVDSYMGMMFDSPNDLVIHSNGTVYFTNPVFELGGRPPGFGLATFRIDPAGVLSLIAQGQCNGIALSPDEKNLYVLQFGGASLWNLNAEGVPSPNPSNLPFGGDGMAVDCAGNVYVSGRIYDPKGQALGNYVTGGTNLAFGGENGKTLLVVGMRTQVRELQMTVPGLP